ncbi:MAG TPA: cytochrome b [Sphingomicrobium sp.]|nr:cytochrome b [Sphingomicrobium sp.]
MNDRSTLQTATRIAAGDDKTDYDNVAIFLHWATALLVLFQFASAEIWDALTKPTREITQSLHISAGILLAAVIIARLIWRLIPGHQRPSIVSGWVETASKGVHYLLYALLVVQAGLGFAFRWAQKEPLSFFGLFAIPSPLGTADKATRHALHGFHVKVGWAIVIIVLGHAFAALYHHYKLQDRVLGRMLPLARRHHGDATVG